ncbi:SnoaL-like domain protein [Streptomyces sp. ADI96-02]|uniref:nuclear transport factor 2 family protein n=1 Tax=Streptomyces sp. ADI96-02 TaxID=1522760 RepID=UPI000F552E55|nr:nuclear transport factor 2 family protein [Streptomyces sp. ADI96-02]RPK67707.1 SnoaL-like domain protein [Streptomyces sp. ADI96-02]
MEQGVSDQVNQFLRSLEAFDFSGAQAMCTGAATVRQNDGKGEQPIDESLDQFKSFVGNVDSLRYDVIRQFQSQDEVFQQHVLHLVMSDGSRSTVHAAVYFRFEGGLIDGIEEYVYAEPAGTTP